MAAKKSTIVRAYARLAGSGTRALFWLLERGAPGLGGRLAERLWFTLPRARPAATPPRTGPAGDGTAFEVAVDGRRVRGRRWGGGPVVYLVHGWGGSAGQLDALVAPLVRSGFSVVSYDAPSHGASDPGASGRRISTIPEASEALLAVVARFGRAHGVVAHSLGATAAATALRDGLRAGRMVLIAPLAHPLPYSYAFAERFGFGERIRRRLVARIERRVGLPMSDFDVPAIPRQVATPRTNGQGASAPPLPPIPVVLLPLVSPAQVYCAWKLCGPTMRQSTPRVAVFFFTSPVAVSHLRSR